MNEEGVLKDRNVEDASFGIEIDIDFSTIGEETSWKFRDVNSVSAVLSSGVISIGLVGNVIE